MSPVHKSQKGMAVAEFALVLPVFVLLMFAIVEFGAAFYKKQILASAAREGARGGVVAVDPRPSATDVEQEVYAYLDSVGLDSSRSVVTVSGAGGASGDLLTVEVSYPADIGVIASFLAGGEASVSGIATLTARSVSELE